MAQVLDTGGAGMLADFFGDDFDPVRALAMCKDGSYSRRYFSKGLKRYQERQACNSKNATED